MKAGLAVRLIQYFLALWVLAFAIPVSAASSDPYEVVEVTDGGSISGTVTFNGTPPEPLMLITDTDEDVCGSEMPSEELIVDGNGGIFNVVLSIEDIETGKDWDFSDGFVYDQKNCRFDPHVMIVRPKEKGVVMNSDDLIHNVHTISRGIFSFNKAVDGGNETEIREKKIRKPGIVRVQCDIHNWMRGWWIVAENPYTELTNREGSFSIENIPAGHYTLKTWHEKLGESHYPIEVEAGKVSSMDIELSPEAG